jgi:hypothetical protein
MSVGEAHPRLSFLFESNFFSKVTNGWRVIVERWGMYPLRIIQRKSAPNGVIRRHSAPFGVIQRHSVAP